MSAHNRRLDLSRDAVRDISDALLYTRRRWGANQRSRYKAAIDEALRLLTQFPELGILGDDLQHNLRAIPVEQHVIYYSVHPDSIRVERVLHNRSDSLNVFTP